MSNSPARKSNRKNNVPAKKEKFVPSVGNLDSDLCGIIELYTRPGGLAGVAVLGVLTMVTSSLVVAIQRQQDAIAQVAADQQKAKAEKPE